MTLNDLERRNGPYFAFFTEFDRFSGGLYHSGWRYTYSVRKILSPSSSLLLLAKTITHLAARSLCDSWASCYHHCDQLPALYNDYFKYDSTQYGSQSKGEHGGTAFPDLLFSASIVPLPGFKC